MDNSIKMVRYSSFREDKFKNAVDPLTPSNRKQHHQHNNTEVPESSVTSVHVLKQLRKLNDYKQMLKGRLSALKVLQQKERRKGVVLNKKQKFYQQIHDHKEQSKEKKQQYLQLKQQKLVKSQQKARTEKKVHESKLKNAQVELSKSKSKDYASIKEKRTINERFISQTKEKQIEHKKYQSSKVMEEDRKQRINVSNFIARKKTAISISKQESVRQLQNLKEENEREIEQLNRLQKLMIEKRAQSRMSRNQSQVRLSRIRDGNNSTTYSTVKLPAINKGPASLRQKSERVQV